MALPAVKHMDPVVGIDVHSVIVTPGLPPVFLPHPHVGFMLDLREYVEAAKGVIGSIAMTIAEEAVQDYLKDHPDDSKKLTDALNSLDNQKKQAERDPMVAEMLRLNRDVSSIRGDVANAVGAGVGMGGAAGRPIFVNGLMRATAGTHSFHVPGLHFPLGETFAPPDPLPSDDAESYMGSRTVLANNDPMSFLALPAMSCWAEGIEPPPHNGAHTARTHVSMPSSVMLPIPVGRPVLVGGPPVMNMAAAAKGMFKAFQGSKWAKKLADKLHLKSGFLRCTVLKAEPVDVTTGEVVVQQNDFTVSGRLPLVWDRYYASHDRHAGAVGFGWQTPADIRLELMRNEDGIGAAACFPDHATAFDMVPADDGWPARTYDWQHGHALYRDDGRMALRTREGIEYGFVLPSRWRDAVAALDGDDSRLTLPIGRMADLNGNAWVFERDVYGGLVRLVEWKRDGRTERVVECGTGSGLHAGLLTSLTLIDADGNAHPLVSYEHDRERNLAAAIDAMAHPHHFEYAAGHRMVSHTSARGVSFYYSYQQGDDGVWRVDHAWGDNGLFDYRFVYDRARMETRVTNSLGHTTITQMNERGMPVAEIDPLGGVTGYRYDTQGRASAVIDTAGRTTAWEYDAYGSLVAQTLPDGSVVRADYDADGRPVCITMPTARQLRYEWDEHGHLRSRTTSSRAVSRYVYDAYGQLVSYSGSRGAITRFEYDRDGNLATVTDALGNRTRYVRDARGRVVWMADPRGQVGLYEYDGNGNLTRAVLPGGKEIRCEFDDDGNLVHYRDPAGQSTTLAYSPIGLVERRIAPSGGIVDCRYDTEGQLVGVVNERGEQYALKRDPLGRIVSESDYWGQTWHYRYGGSGELLCSTDPLGRVVEYQYDRCGRIVEKLARASADDAFVQVHRFAYDQCGNLILAENDDSRVEFCHDADGRVIEEKQGDDFTINNVFDAAGNRIERRTRLLSEGALIEHVVHYEYDVLNAVVSIRIDGSAAVVIERDDLGQAVSERLGPALRRAFSYEAGGQLAVQTLFASTGTMFASEYAYDPNGEVIEKRDERGRMERFEYDSVGRVVSHLGARGIVRRLAYDLAGDLLRTRVSGYDAAALADAEKAANWIRDGEYEGCYCAFDRAGNMVHRRDAEQNLALCWDSAGQLRETIALRPATADVASARKHTRTQYEYDALRRRTRKLVQIESEGEPDSVFSYVSCFFWDGDALVGERTTGGWVGRAGRAEQDERDATSLAPPSPAGSKNGNWLTLQSDHVCEWFYYPRTFHPLGVVHGYSGEKRELARATVGSPSKADATYFYQSDPNGAPVRMLDVEGNVAWEASYDANGGIEQFGIQAMPQPLRLQGQYFDAETGMSYNRHRYYDARIGQFVSEDPIRLSGGENLYRYCVNSISWADPLGLDRVPLFDPNNRLSFNAIWAYTGNLPTPSDVTVVRPATSWGRNSGVLKWQDHYYVFASAGKKSHSEDAIIDFIKQHDIKPSEIQGLYSILSPCAEEKKSCLEKTKGEGLEFDWSLFHQTDNVGSEVRKEIGALIKNMKGV